MNAGGIGEVLTAFVKHQKNWVNHIEVWHPNEESDSQEFAEETGLDINNIKAFKTIGSNKIGFSTEMIKAAANHKNDFDIIHQHGLWLPLSMASLKMGNGKAKKIISPHGFLNANALTISSKKKKLAATLFEHRNLKSADCLMACSDFEKGFIREYNLDQPVSVIPNGVHQSFVDAKGNPNEFVEKHNLQGKKILFFLSRIHPSKGLKLLIESFNKIKTEMKDWVLIIAGIDELNHEQELKNFCSQNNLNNQVKFIGPSFGQDKVNAFDASDVFILPTDTENFGIVVVQALARKKPVITTRFAPWADLEKYNCGWWINKTEAELKEVLLKINNALPEELKEKGNNGFQLVNEKYLWEAAAKRSFDTYQWLLNNGTAPSYVEVVKAVSEA